MSAKPRPECAMTLVTGLALIDQFWKSLNAANATTEASAAEEEHPSPLLLFKAAAESLKSSTTKLSLLSITAPFTESAVLSLVKPLNDSILPSLVTAALLVTPAEYPDSFASETRRFAQGMLAAFKQLLELVLARANDGKPKAELKEQEKKTFTEATGRVWDSCDAATSFSSDGLSGFVVKKAEQWLALMKDAVQELQEWDPEEDVDDIFGNAGSDDEEVSKFTDKQNDQDQITIAAGAKEQALKVLSRIPQSIHVVVKQRLAKLPLAVRNGSQRLSSAQRSVLNNVIRDIQRVSECIDESAEAIYMGDPELCLKKAGEARAVTINVVTSVIGPWEMIPDGTASTKEDTFIQRALAWIQQVDTTPNHAASGNG